MMETAKMVREMRFMSFISIEEIGPASSHQQEAGTKEKQAIAYRATGCQSPEALWIERGHMTVCNKNSSDKLD